MTREEAIALLAGCVPLAKRVAAQGPDLELTEADRAMLEGFNQVWLYEDGWWMDDTYVHRQAGLQRSDIAVLVFMLDWLSNKKMRQQQASGEQDD